MPASSSLAVVRRRAAFPKEESAGVSRREVAAVVGVEHSAGITLCVRHRARMEQVDLLVDAVGFWEYAPGLLGLMS
jgi:hypothetical protein